jgi:AraC-like DNA-binding protein
MKFYLMAGDDIKKLSPKYRFKITDITALMDPALKIRFAQQENEFTLNWIPSHKQSQDDIKARDDSSRAHMNVRFFHSKLTTQPNLHAQSETAQDLHERISATYQFLIRDINTPLINRTRLVFTSNVNRQITLRAIARQLGVNEQRINKVFTNAFGFSAKLWVRKYRIYQACKLIAETNDSITAIAHSMGFSAPSNFTPAFAKEIGMSPRQFKKLITSI